jgi:hypothetical protein
LNRRRKIFVETYKKQNKTKQNICISPIFLGKKEGKNEHLLSAGIGFSPVQNGLDNI